MFPRVSGAATPALSAPVGSSPAHAGGWGGLPSGVAKPLPDGVRRLPDGVLRERQRRNRCSALRDGCQHPVNGPLARRELRLRTQNHRRTVPTKDQTAHSEETHHARHDASLHSGPHQRPRGRPLGHGHPHGGHALARVPEVHAAAVRGPEEGLQADGRPRVHLSRRRARAPGKPPSPTRSIAATRF